MRPIWFGVVLAAALAVPTAPVSAASAGASGAVERLQDALVEAMKLGAGFDERARVIDPAVRQTFNLAGMAEISVGRYWRQMSDPQRDRFVEAFARMSIAIYADRFRRFSGQRFVVLGEAAGPARDTQWVRTEIVIPGERESVALSYLLRRGDEGGWAIMDVYLDGAISELAVRRSEYVSVIRAKGIDALIDGLESRASRLAGG